MLRGASERLAPIMHDGDRDRHRARRRLQSAASIPGHEIEHPMAIVILGGLVDLDAAEPVPAPGALRPASVHARRREGTGPGRRPGRSPEPAVRRSVRRRRCGGTAAGEHRERE